MATPPRHAIDRVLWQFLSTPHAFLQAMLWVSLVLPVLVTMVTYAAGPAWLAAPAYVATAVAAVAAGRAIMRSHARWLAWRKYESEQRSPVYPPEVYMTRTMIEKLIERDKARDWNG